ncbi:MAG: hypothetical protein JWR40_105 [Massilia sp.]|nr:hypothetical protein [Massilia sp.]
MKMTHTAQWAENLFLISVNEDCNLDNRHADA